MANQLASLVLAIAGLNAIAVYVVTNAQIVPIGKTARLSGSEQLNQSPEYLVSWLINEAESSIYFNISVETIGYIGFGISPTGGMVQADIFIAGVYENGSWYSSDRYAVENGLPEKDTSVDYFLEFASETDTHTHLSFHRLLNTCDVNDMEITDETMKIIWAVGTTDDIRYHNSNRGTKSINFYLGNADDFPVDQFTALDITKETEMPAEHTTYWCSIHELPKFNETRHVVAFEPVLENPDSLAHTHHFIFHRCIAPEGEDPDNLFKQWTTHEGDLCYNNEKNPNFPFKNYCNGNMVYTWSKGGKRMVFPDNIGFSINDNISKPVYYALEVHYDNPQKESGKKFKTGGRIYHTDRLRSIEAGLMVVMQETAVQLTIPPQTQNFVVSGHCSPECTENLFPQEGITVFNSMLHAHLTGRKIKLRHFREDQELEWVDKDDYYDFDFQQNKQLIKPKRIEKGDQLTVECTHNTTGVANGMAVIGGLSSHEEMCQAWIFYYPKQNFTACGSAQELSNHFGLFEVTNYTEGASEFPGGMEEWIIIKPDHLAGNYLESISKKVNWTADFKVKYQQEKRFGEQIGTCNDGLKKGVKINSVVKYPENLKEFEPINECGVGTETPTESFTSGSTEEESSSSSIIPSSSYSLSTTESTGTTESSAQNIQLYKVFAIVGTGIWFLVQ